MRGCAHSRQSHDGSGVAQQGPDARVRAPVWAVTARLGSCWWEASRRSSGTAATMPACEFAPRTAVRFPVGVDQTSVSQVISLCKAVRDAKSMLALTDEQQIDLLRHVGQAECAAVSVPADLSALESEVRVIRYLLIEVAEGPVSAFLTDAAARIIGDGVGRLFRS